MEWKDWQNLPFALRDRLPEESGIYVVADQHDFVWYVGQASNLRNRWVGRGHHRYPQLIRTNRKLNHTIYWKAVPASDLDDQEQNYVSLFKPELNGCNVKTYLPKKPQHEREIKRLLRTLNNLTELFPVLRSVVAGQYVENDGIPHILIVITLNDLCIIHKSTRKRSSSVRQSWNVIQSYCGKEVGQYNSTSIRTYSISGYCFEFLYLPELLDFLIHSPDEFERHVGTAELLGVEVQALRDLDFLDSLGLREIHWMANSDGMKSLREAAYLLYRKQQLRPLEILIPLAVAEVEV